MVQHNFIDHVRVCCHAGKGGDGMVHFHREKFVAKGGPDGGDGGRGGHVILRGNNQYWTLLHLRYRKHVVAEDGINGGIKNQSGRQGEDLYLDVPLGTVVRDVENEALLGEILENGQTQVIARGGEGGRGNHHFKSATNQVPEYAEDGEPVEENWRIFELQLLADVGLVGFPNAGKSTLLSVLSDAKPAIADYPFTTVAPNLGVVFHQEYESFVIADLPGLLEGAHEGRGKGTTFLRHVERNAVLLFLVSAENLEVQEQYEALLDELKAYDPGLLDKERIVAITKADMLDEELKAQLKQDLSQSVSPVFISAVSQYGIQELKTLLWHSLNRKETQRE